MTTIQSLVKNCRKITGWALLLTMLPMLTAALWAQSHSGTHTIVTSGFSRIYGNVADARNAALAESIRFAIQKATESLLSEEQVTRNFETISRVVHQNPNQYIQDYRILKEFQVDRSYRVLVSARVMTDRIQGAISSAGLQTRSEELPTVLFMLAEKHLNDVNYGYWWKEGSKFSASDTASFPMAGTLLEAGYTVINPLSIEESREVLSKGLSLTETPADYEAAIFARRAGARLAVLGKAEAKYGQNRMGNDIRTFNGNVSLRVIDTQTGELVTSIRRQAVSIGDDPASAASNAMADAAFQAGLQLSSRIESLWRQQEEPAGGIKISITGKNILPDLEQIRRTISALPRISTVRTMQMTPDTARLWVDFKGTPDELVDRLLTQSYGPFGINIKEISPDQIEMSVIRGLTSETLTE